MTKKQRLRKLIWEFMALALLLSAFFLALQSGLAIDWWDMRELLSVCLIVAAFVAISGYNRWLTVGGCVLGILVLGCVFCLNRTGIRKEIQYFVPYVIRLVNEYYETSYRYRAWFIHGDIEMSLLAVALPLGMILGLGIHGWNSSVGERRYGKRKVRKSRDRKRQWWRVLFLLPLAVAFFSGLLLGYEPGIGAVLCLVLGMSFLLLLYGEQGGLRGEQDPADFRKRNTQLFLCACAAIAVSGLCYLPLSGKVLKYHKTFKHFQVSIEDTLKNIMDGNHILAELSWRLGLYDDTVTLTNRQPNLTNDKIFTVTVEEKPSTALYFKTFVGGDYDNGIWYPPDEKELADYCRQQGIDSRDMGQYAFHQPELIAVSYVPEPWNMTVKIAKRNTRLSPYPYYFYGVSIPEGAEVVGDSGICVSKSGLYELTMGQLIIREKVSRDIITEEPVDDDGTENFDEDSPDVMETVRTSDEDEAGATYQAYVNEVYTRLPHGQLLRMQEAYENGYFNYISNLECSYSLDLEPVPEGEDAIEYFMFDSRKGYCMHFASAATILYRMMGIPARYVSGYVVSPNEFVENEDGTYTAVVTGKRAHAWVETYHEINGWMYSEETPSGYAERFLNAEYGESPRDIVNEIEREDQPSDITRKPEPDKTPNAPANNPSDTPDTPANQTNPSNQPAQNGEDNTKFKSRGGIFGLGIGFETGSATVDRALTVTVYVLSAGILLGIVILGFRIRRFLLWRRRNRSFQGSDDKRAAAAIVREIFRLLALSGIIFTGGMDEIDFANEAERKLPCMKKGDFVRFVEIARVARYGEKPLTEGQRKYMLMIYKRLRYDTAEKLNWGGRLWYRYGDVRV